MAYLHFEVETYIQMKLRDSLTGLFHPCALWIVWVRDLAIWKNCHIVGIIAVTIGIIWIFRLKCRQGNGIDV